MNLLTNITRADGDPKVLHTGPSSLKPADKLSRVLGYVSFGLGIAELVAARRITRALGIEGCEALVRAFGAREIAAGVLTLSTEKESGLWARLGGDALDISVLVAALSAKNARRDNIGLALAAVVGITVLDAVAAEEVTRRHSRGNGHVHSYRDRTGFPQGVESARGTVSARDTDLMAAQAAE